jgi:hypothetical protein
MKKFVLKTKNYDAVAPAGIASAYIYAKAVKAEQANKLEQQAGQSLYEAQF